MPSREVIKKPYIDLIKTIRKYRLDSFNSLGITLIPKAKITELVLKNNVTKLFKGGIINKFDETDQEDLKNLGFDGTSEDFNRYYIEHSFNDIAYYIFSTSTLEKIDEFLKQITRSEKEINGCIVEEISRDTNERKNKAKQKPFVITSSKRGYLKFYKEGRKIFIGGIETRHFRLLQCLLEPFGVAKTINAVFDSIKLLRDEKDSILSGYDEQMIKSRKVTLISNSIKELQKRNKLEGKLFFKWDSGKNKIWIEFLQ